MQIGYKLRQELSAIVSAGGVLASSGKQYPERFAQEALGHNSKAVHRAYAKKAEVRIDSLDAWEKKMNGKVVPLEFPKPPAVASPDAVQPSQAKSG